MTTLIRRLPLPAFAAAAWLAALSIPAAAHAQTAPLLLAKYNFEDIPAHVPNWGAGYKGTYKPATGWKTPFVVKLDSKDPHSGAHALRIELLQNPAENETGGERLVHSPHIEVPAFTSTEPGQLVAHFYVRTQGVSEGGVGIRILERDENQVSLGLLAGEESIIEIPETSGWRELSFEGRLRTKTRSIAFMIVLNAQQQAPATIWIDDIALEYQWPRR